MDLQPGRDPCAAGRAQGRLREQLHPGDRGGRLIVELGSGVALSSDANTSGDGAAWAFTRTGTAWSQDGSKLVGDCTVSCASSGTGETGAGAFGSGVALSGTGGAALIGAPNDAGSVGAAWAFTTPTATTTALTSSQNPSQIGQSVTFTATVSPTPDAGTVDFTDDNGAQLCAGAVLTSGVATCQTSFAAGASYPVVATYSGDTAYAGSISPTVTQVVSGGATMTTIQSSSNPGMVAQPVTYTATVTPTPDGGTVSFADGESHIPGCGAVAVSSGTATCMVTYPAVGTHSIIATYSGDASFGAGDTNSLAETIDPNTPTVTITASANPSHGGAVTYTATVTPTPDGGQIGFTQDTVYTQLCPPTPISSGAATCRTTYITTGSHQIYAFYSGDANYAKSYGQLGESVTPGGSYANSSIAISIAQQAGDPAQTGPSGSSLAYNGVPLVTGRATVARVFADPTGLVLAGTSGLQAMLYGSVNGQPLPGSPLSEDDGGPKALADAEFDPQLGLSDTAFNFLLPASWTQGEVELRAVVAPESSPPPSTTATCVGACSASLTLKTVHFHDVPTFEVTPVELTWTNKATGALEAPGNPQAAMATAYHLMPVQKIVNEGYQGTIDETALQSDKGGLGGNQANADALNLVVQWATTQFLNSTGSSNGNLHDMVVGFNVQIARGNTEYDPTLGAITNAKGTAIDTVEEPVAVVNAAEQIGVAHEMGHGVGRRHADEKCGGPAGGGSDPNWPDYLGLLEPTTAFANGHTGVWSSITTPPLASYGINPEWRVTSSNGPGPLMVFPNSDYDYMSYCGALHEANPTESDPGTVWTSARGWQQEYACMSKTSPPPGCPVNEQQPADGEIPVSGHAAHVAAAAPSGATDDIGIRGPSIAFLGYLLPGGSLLSPSLMPSVGGAAGPSGSAVTATLVNRRGRVVATEPLATQPMHFDSYPGHPAVPLVALQGSIPTHGQTIAGLVLRSGGHVTARIAAPRQAPRVTVTVPRLTRRRKTLTVRWNSHDRSGARRTVFIAFSTTGRRYTTIWEGFDQGRAAIPLTQFRGARRVCLRVSVTDGFQSSVATTRPIRLAVLAKKASAGPPPAWSLGLERAGIDVLSP